MNQQRPKRVYVKLLCEYLPSGQIRPLALTLPDGRHYNITRLVLEEKAGPTSAGPTTATLELLAISSQFRLHPPWTDISCGIEQEVPHMFMQAVVIEVQWGRLLVLDLSTRQRVLVNTPDASFFRPSEVVRIWYNGIMTMSIPPQITALSITAVPTNTLPPVVFPPIFHPPFGHPPFGHPPFGHPPFGRPPDRRRGRHRGEPGRRG